MTEEVLPRFDMPELNFLTVNANSNEQRIISKYEEISGRTLANGDPVRLFLLSLAAEITQLRQDINIAARQNLLTYAQGDHLDALGIMVNTYRIPAKGATVTLRYTLSQALSEIYVIPQGTKASDGTTIFEVNENYEIPAGNLYIDVIATCSETGSFANDIAIGAINTMVDPMPQMESVTNTEQPSGGADREDDSAYAERIRLAPESFSVAGPHDSYEYYAKSFSGAIIDVSIYGLSEHPGNVYIHPLLTDGTLPETAFLNELKDYLSQDDIRPLTDNLLVISPTAETYTINITWYLDSNDISKISQITASVLQAVENYRIWQQSKIGRDINPDVLIKMVREAGAKRCVITAPVFTTIDKDHVAQCPASNVTIAYGGAEDA